MLLAKPLESIGLLDQMVEAGNQYAAVLFGDFLHRGRVLASPRFAIRHIVVKDVRRARKPIFEIQVLGRQIETIEAIEVDWLVAAADNQRLPILRDVARRSRLRR